MPRFQTRPVAPAQVEAVQLREPATVGKTKGRRGDWLLTDPDGGIRIVKAKAFVELYEAIVGPPRPLNGNQGGGGPGKPSVRRRPRAPGRRPKPAGQKSPAAARRESSSSQLTAAQLADMRTQFERGDSADAIAKRLSVSVSTVYYRATAGKWKRSAPSAPAAKATAAPKGEKLSGSTRCPNCDVYTEYDPCEHCKKKLKRSW